jgi:hypothetical protein
MTQNPTCFSLVTFFRKVTDLLGCHQIILRPEACQASLFRRIWVRITDSNTAVLHVHLIQTACIALKRYYVHI